MPQAIEMESIHIVTFDNGKLIQSDKIPATAQAESVLRGAIVDLVSRSAHNTRRGDNN